jgi:hypothetical protein
MSHLRLVRSCPAALVPSAYRAIDLDLRQIRARLDTLIRSADGELGDEGLADALREAGGAVSFARVKVAEGAERRQGDAG